MLTENIFRDRVPERSGLTSNTRFIRRSGQHSGRDLTIRDILYHTSSEMEIAVVVDQEMGIIIKDRSIKWKQ